MGIINFFLLYSPGTWSRATRLDWEVEEDQDGFAWGSGKGKNPRVWFCKPLIEWTSVTWQEDSTQAYGMGPQCCCLDSQFLHYTIKFTSYLLIPVVIFTFSNLNKVKKPWITELKLQQTSFTLSSCAISVSLCDVHCMGRFRSTFEF